MSQQNQNGEFGEHELVKISKTQMARVWKSLHQAILAVDRLSHALDSVAAEPECAVSTSHKRQETNRHRTRHRSLCFHDEGDAELQRIISAVMEQSDKNEIYRKPSELLEVARSVRALSWKIADIQPTADKDKRSERTALAKYFEIHKGRTFTVWIRETHTKVKFDAIGRGHTRLYRFTKLTNEAPV
jgi:hypothetical protein